MKTIRTRFAPSPTGYLHVGGIRTALFAFLVARQAKGQFILRLEDTDKNREVDGSAEHLIASLKALGLQYDEGPDIGGPFAPYKQSDRLDHYKKWAEKLIEQGRAYADPYTPEEVQQFREQSQDAKKAFLYRDYRPENPPAWDGSQPLRFKSDPKPYIWHDEIMGDISTGPEVVDDFILIKSDGYPTYNFAHIIDDLEMEVSHVIRGQEFISSMPNYLNLYEALGFDMSSLGTTNSPQPQADEQAMSASERGDSRALGGVGEAVNSFHGESEGQAPLDMSASERGDSRALGGVAPQTDSFRLQAEGQAPLPIFCHAPHIMNEQGNKKLGKRDGAKDVLDYVRDGYLPEALVSFIATLGWNDGTTQEVFTIEELISKFNLNQVGRSGARFDEKRLLWVNGHFIRELPLDELYKRVEFFWPEAAKKADEAYKKQVLALAQDRLKTLRDLAGLTSYFFEEPSKDLSLITDNKQLKKLSSDEISNLIDAAQAKLSQLPNWTTDSIQNALNELLEETDQKPGILFSLIRLHTTWAPFSPQLNDTLALLGKETTLQRLLDK